MNPEESPTRHRWVSALTLSIIALAIIILLLIIIAYATGFASRVTPGENFYGNWPAVFLAFLIFALFLLAFLKPWRQRSWRELGIAQAYLVALFTEMFGLPLTIYFLASAFGVRIGLSGEEGHLWASLLASTGLLGLSSGVALVMIASVLLISSGIILIVLGWRELYRGSGLVTTGVYRWVRHPQYLGFFVIIAGFLVQWPTIITAVMAPILFYAYYRLALREEDGLRRTFGAQYEGYAVLVPGFLPRLSRRGR
ncbi:MAG: methyltransferase family protein [Thermoplasmata archaeon]